MNSITVRSALRQVTRRSFPTYSQLPRLVKANTYSTDSTPYSSSENNSANKYIITSTPRPGVGQIIINNWKALNALSTPLFKELNKALRAFDDDKAIGAIVITGTSENPKGDTFAAGADIREMTDLTFSQVYNGDFLELWSKTMTTLSKPTIAAVSGYALGGGCELAMMSDIVYCNKSATFGQVEIKLAVIPGAGGSQRLTRAIGKAKAMDIILTGRTFSGTEAEKWGVAARVFDTTEEVLNAALESAETIAGYSRIAIKAAKEVVNESQELSLAQGVKYERKVFHSLFGTKDQKIGMTAFKEHKPAVWEHE